MDILGSWRRALDLNGGPIRPPEGDVRAAYEAEYPSWVRRGALAYCLVGIVVLLAAVPLDRARFPDRVTTLVTIRVGGALLLLALAALLGSARAERHPRALALLVPATAGAVLQALAAMTGGLTSPMVVSTNFLILGIGFLIPLPLPWMAAACGVVIAGYGASVVLLGANVGWRVFDNVFFFTMSSIIALATAFYRDRRRWREFTDRWALAAASRDSRETSQRYRSVVDTAGSAILVVSPDGHILEVNREAERMLGWPRDQVIWRDVRDLVPHLAPHAGPACVDEPQRGLEATVCAKDGTELTLVCNTSPLRDATGNVVGVVVCGEDITDRKRAEDALRASEARLRTVISNAPVVVFTLDAAGVVTLSEGRGLERLGLRPSDVVGRHITTAASDLGIDPVRYGAFVDRALGGELVSWQGTVGDATFETRLTTIRDANGRVAGVLGLAIDLTERQQAEEARLALERKLLETQKLESLGVLAGGIAHDFNNLLMSVLGNASLALAEVPDDAPIADQIRQIETAARRGSELTRQMLAYAGHGTIELEAVDVNALVQEMSGLLRVSIARRARTTYDLAPDLPPVEADPTQVRQIVMNLLTNASEAIGDADGAITIRTGIVELDAAALAGMRAAPQAVPGPYVRIEVADTGCGMAPETIDRIFDPFFSTKFTGRGLGLATVLGIVRGHGGALEVESTVGRGTAFRVHLPCATPRRAQKEESAMDDRSSAPASESRTVLLVDDETDVRTVTQHMLERLGCHVLVAGDGREGVDVFRAHAGLIDAVIVDLSLPRLNGEQAFGEIRRIRPDARVILMSGYDDERTTRRLTDLGLAGFLRKPFSVGDLRSIMQQATRVSA
ncbi:MAG TPA: PAS domain S-box protein [Candidatus Binatia bacterium]|nr:PAS domain S-box protein [Candidatus Binatia bacterium]